MTGFQTAFRAVERSFYIGNIISGVLYGLMIAICFQSVYYLQHSRVRAAQKRFYICFCLVLTAINAICLAANGLYGQFTWIEEGRNPTLPDGTPGDPGFYFYENTTWWVNTLGTSAAILSTMMADGLLLYRCYIVLGQSIWSVSFPALLYVSSSALGIASTTIAAHPDSFIYTGQAGRMALAWITLSVAFNILVTSMIAFRIVYARWQIWRTMRLSFPNRLEKIDERPRKGSPPVPVRSFPISPTSPTTSIFNFKSLKLKKSPPLPLSNQPSVSPAVDRLEAEIEAETRSLMDNYTGVVAILVESALPLAISGAVTSVLFGMGHSAVYALSVVWGGFVGISPQLIIMRVAMGKAWSKRTMNASATLRTPASSTPWSHHQLRPPAMHDHDSSIVFRPRHELEMSELSHSNARSLSRGAHLGLSVDTTLPQSPQPATTSDIIRERLRGRVADAEAGYAILPPRERNISAFSAVHNRSETSFLDLMDKD